MEFIAFCSKEKAQYESQGQALHWTGWARGCVCADGSVQSHTHTHTHTDELTHSETSLSRLTHSETSSGELAQIHVGVCTHG